jgi:hypothetical protein
VGVITIITLKSTAQLCELNASSVSIFCFNDKVLKQILRQVRYMAFVIHGRKISVQAD